MRNAIRTVLSLAAMAAMLGGMLGQARSGAAPTAQPDLAALQQLALIGQAVREEPASPTYSYAKRVHTRISVNPDPLQPVGDTIEISIADQRLTAWRDGKIVYRFKISTAKPGYRTPKGHFKVLNKANRWWSRQWQVWMPDALRFYGSYFIHSLPYRSNPNIRNGAARLGQPDSHGCVRVNIGDSRLLYDWASVGTPVWVH